MAPRQMIRRIRSYPPERRVTFLNQRRSLPNKSSKGSDRRNKAKFREMCSNIADIETGVLHAGLSDQDRINLVRRFNDEQNFWLVLIIMHSLSFQEVNLDRCKYQYHLTFIACPLPLYTDWFSPPCYGVTKITMILTRFLHAEDKADILFRDYYDLSFKSCFWRVGDFVIKNWRKRQLYTR